MVSPTPVNSKQATGVWAGGQDSLTNSICYKAYELSARISEQGIGCFTFQDPGFSEQLLRTKTQEEVDATTQEPGT